MSPSSERLQAELTQAFAAPDPTSPPDRRRGDCPQPGQARRMTRVRARQPASLRIASGSSPLRGRCPRSPARHRIGTHVLFAGPLFRR